MPFGFVWEVIRAPIALTEVASLDNQGAKITADHLKTQI
jgi:hypothetical protein